MLVSGAIAVCDFRLCQDTVLSRSHHGRCRDRPCRASGSTSVSIHGALRCAALEEEPPDLGYRDDREPDDEAHEPLMQVEVDGAEDPVEDPELGAEQDHHKRAAGADQERPVLEDIEC